MASNTNFIDDYLDPNRESLRQTAQTYYDQAAKNNQDATEDYIASNDEIYDAAATYFRNAAYKQQQQLPQDYQYAYDTNAIQQRINERQVADRQAQLGLTDSGLNRTQQAAINLQRSNADQAVTQQRNAQYNAIQSALMEYLAGNSQQKAASAAQARYDLANRNQDLYNTYMTNADSMAASIASNLYSADQQRAAAEAQAVADAQAAQYDAILKQYELGLKYGGTAGADYNLVRNMASDIYGDGYTVSYGDAWNQALSLLNASQQNGMSDTTATQDTTAQSDSVVLNPEQRLILEGIATNPQPGVRAEKLLDAFTTGRLGGANDTENQMIANYMGKLLGLDNFTA